MTRLLHSAVFAHGFGGTNGLPIPRWLLAYLVAFAIVLAFVVLRVTRPPRRDRRAARDELDAGTGTGVAERRRGPWFRITRAIGLVLFTATFVCAAVGTNDSGANISTVTVIVLFFLGMQVVAALAGDVYWWFDPLDTIAAGLFRGRTDERIAPDWTGAAFLAGFIWFVFVYPEFYPPTPHEVAGFLAIYTLAVVVGAATWGRGWVRDGEGFSALFGALASIVHRRPRPRGLTALLVVYLGGIAFDGLSQTNWWIDVLGTSRGWTERAINTMGLVWTIAVIAGAYLGATRVVAAVTRSEPPEVAARFAPMLLPVGLAWSIAHYLPPFLIDVQNVYALVSDPLGRGWDLFGTFDYAVNHRVLTPTEMGIVQSLVLVLGCAGSALVAHDVAFTSYRGRVAVRAVYPLAALLIAAAAGAIWLLLGV